MTDAAPVFVVYEEGESEHEPGQKGLRDLARHAARKLGALDKAAFAQNS